AQTEQEIPHGEASALLAALRRAEHTDTVVQTGEPEPPRTPLSLSEAYRMCLEITRKHSRSFFLSTQLLPPEKRQAIRALYAFCRTSDDLVDQPQVNAMQALAAWVALVQAPQPPPDNPVLLAWNDTALRYAVPRALPDELLAGIAMDLTVNRYQTFDDLWLYCYRVASVVGLISMRIIGYREGAVNYAIKLGVALQLTNILRDVGEDAQRGRIYLPQEDLERFGLCDEDILRGRYDEPFRALMRFEIERANRLYEEAWPGIALLNPDGQLAIAAAAEIYRGILGRIQQNYFDVYRRRAYVPLARKLLLLWRARRRLRSGDKVTR
ncbi:MAG TPA: phytoene/squalene synthase family protein, partial [Roseiflexaceae bacterium]|nr:phytoene/squalene synthase family protein [Roseiflexaceae bacterium]